MPGPRSPRAARARLAAGLATLALGLGACGAGDSSGAGGAAAGSAEDVVAVASTTQLGSVLATVTQCAGTGSATLLGPGDDPHDVSLSSAQVAQMVRSGLVFLNGLGLEGGMDSAARSAELDGARLVEVAPRLDPLPFGAAAEPADAHDADHDHADDAGEDHGEDHGHAGHDHAGHDHGSLDPHVWMDVARMAEAAAVMGDELAAHTGDQAYAECGRRVRADLRETDRQVHAILAAVPPERRTLVTDHDAYGYFGAAYGFEVAGVVIPGGSTDAEPSSRELAALTATVRQVGADAILTSVGAERPIVAALAREVGDLPTVALYESGVGPAGSPEEDYAAAMLANARILADALTG